MKNLYRRQVFVGILFLCMICSLTAAIGKNETEESPTKNVTETETEVSEGTRSKRNPISNIARLLFGGTYVSVHIGNMIPDHPLVRYPAPIQASARNMDNVIAAVPGMNGRRMESPSVFHPGSHPLGPASRISQGYNELQRLYNIHSQSQPSHQPSNFQWNSNSFMNPSWSVSNSPSNFLLQDHRPTFNYPPSSQQSADFSRQPFYPHTMQSPGLPGPRPFSQSFASYPTTPAPPQFSQFQPGPSTNTWSSSSSTPWQSGPLPSDSGSRHDNFGPPYYPYEDIVTSDVGPPDSSPNSNSGSGFNSGSRADMSFRPEPPSFEPTPNFDRPAPPSNPDFSPYPPSPQNFQMDMDGPPSTSHQHEDNYGPSSNYESSGSPHETIYHHHHQENYPPVPQDQERRPEYNPPPPPIHYESYPPPSSSSSSSSRHESPADPMLQVQVYRDPPSGPDSISAYPYSTSPPVIYKTSKNRHKSHKSYSKSKSYRKAMKQRDRDRDRMPKPVVEFYPKSYDTRRYDHYTPTPGNHRSRSKSKSRKSYRPPYSMNSDFAFQMDHYGPSGSVLSPKKTKVYPSQEASSISSASVSSVSSASSASSPTTLSDAPYTKKSSKSAQRRQESPIGQDPRIHVKTSPGHKVTHTYTLAPADSYGSSRYQSQSSLDKPRTLYRSSSIPYNYQKSKSKSKSKSQSQVNLANPSVTKGHQRSSLGHGRSYSYSSSPSSWSSSSSSSSPSSSQGRSYGSYSRTLSYPKTYSGTSTSTGSGQARSYDQLSSYSGHLKKESKSRTSQNYYSHVHNPLPGSSFTSMSSRT